MNQKIKTLLANAEAYADGAAEAAMKSRGDDQRYKWMMGIANTIAELIVEIERVHTGVDTEEVYQMLVDKLDFGMDDLNAGTQTVDLLVAEGLLKQPKTVGQNPEAIQRMIEEHKATPQGIHQNTFRNFIKFIQKACPNGTKMGFVSPIYYSDDPQSQNIEGYMAEWVIGLDHMLSIEAENDNTVTVYARDFVENVENYFEISFTDNPKVEEQLNEAAVFCQTWLKTHLVQEVEWEI